MKILIADDDEDSREILKLRLGRLGHDVIEASDGLSAWGEYRAHAPKVIISDWVMPEMDGLELSRKVRAAKGMDYAYIIMLSGAMTKKEDYLQAMEAGVDDFLPKPVDAEAFRIRLRVAERIMTLTSRVDALEKILPICCYCKKIKGKDGEYQPVENYFSERSKVKFSHGICPDCLKKQLPEKKA
jgi:DNA-binding response OmpR family regulator